MDRWTPKLKPDHAGANLNLQICTDKDGDYVLLTDHEAAIKEAVEKAVKEKSTECTILNQQITMLHAEYGKRIAGLEAERVAWHAGGKEATKERHPERFT